ncbi:MAG TPA: cupin domain-containing protein [Pirellulales bacterium]
MIPYFVDKSQCSTHNIFPGVTIFTTAGDNVMLSIVELEPHSKVLEHSHPHEQMGYLLEGEFDFTIGGETRTVRAGEMWRIPGNVKHSVVNGPKFSRALDIFQPIREDYR